jgi:WD40 repeat protein
VPGLDGRWISNRPQVVEPGRLLVAPTRPGTSAGARVGEAGPETVSVEATFLDPRSGRVVDSVPVGDTLPLAFGSSVAVSPDRSLVAVTWVRGVTVLDARTHEVVTTVPLPPDTVVYCAGWTPDGSRLLLCAEGPVLDGAAGGLLVVGTGTWQPQPPVDVQGPAEGMATSPDGRMIALGSSLESGIRLLDARTLDLERVVPLAVDDLVGALAFSPDGSLLAAGGDRGLLHVFDTATWRPVGEPAAVHDESLLQVEWLPDSRTVVTTGRDGTVSLFDVDRGLVRARRLPGSAVPGGGFAHLVPSPVEEIVVLSGERPGWRYPLDPAVWLAEACAVVGRDLTAAEWDRYLPGRDVEPTCSDLP